MRHVFKRLASRADQAVIDRHQLEVVGRSLGDNPGTELDVRGADDEALGALRPQIVDRRHQLLAVYGADLDHREALLLRSLVREFPFVLEPRLFRLLDDEADLGFLRVRPIRTRS